MANYEVKLFFFLPKELMSQPCPIIYGTLTVKDLLGETIMEESVFYHNRFSNDELHLTNMKTYYIEVEFMDAINRTFRGRSDGVTVYIQPPEPGAVRDGPHYGEDRNYQQSLDEMAVNWDEFGKDVPGMRVVYYEVALGDDPARSTTMSNVHYFVNVGLSKNYTFTDLRLQAKTVTYYATVRGHAENGAFQDATSNGIKAGFTPGMISGNMEISPYSNASNELAVSWDGFWSDFDIHHYYWGISHSPLLDDNVTLDCQDFLPSVREHFGILNLVDVHQNTFVKQQELDLQHNTTYYMTVIAEDELGQCIAAPSQAVLVDLTPPAIGDITLSGISRLVC